MIWKNQTGLNLIIFEDLNNRVTIFKNYLYIHGYLEYDKHNNTVNILNEIDLFGLFYPNQNLTNKFKV